MRQRPVARWIISLGRDLACCCWTRANHSTVARLSSFAFIHSFTTFNSTKLAACNMKLRWNWLVDEIRMSDSTGTPRTCVHCLCTDYARPIFCHRTKRVHSNGIHTCKVVFVTHRMNCSNLVTDCGPFHLDSGIHVDLASNCGWLTELATVYISIKFQFTATTRFWVKRKTLLLLQMQMIICKLFGLPNPSVDTTMVCVTWFGGV